MRAARLAALVAGLAIALAASAQPYPSKPVKLIVTYPPGGSSDLMARILGQKLSETWGQTVIVESRPGAAGSIGMEYARQQPADGYSFVIGNLGPVVVNPLLSKVPFDVERDFLPVSLISTGPNVLVVNPKTPVKTLGELIAYARANPGKLNFGSGGSGSVAHLVVVTGQFPVGQIAAAFPSKVVLHRARDLDGARSIPFPVDEKDRSADQ